MGLLAQVICLFLCVQHVFIKFCEQWYDYKKKTNKERWTNMAGQIVVYLTPVSVQTQAKVRISSVGF